MDKETIKNIEEMTADEILTNLKGLTNKTDVESLKVEEKNLLLAINSAFDSGQSRLLERSLFLYECLDKERVLLQLGIDKYINSEYIDELLDKLNEKTSNDKMIFLCELDEFPRVIPSNIVKKIRELKEKKIFNSYYVLYTDYTKDAHKIAKGKEVNKREKSKDPILFGVFTKLSEDKEINFLNEKMYFIADWVDEYCDLTLDKLMKMSPESVKSIYNDELESKISKEDLEDLENSAIGKAISTKIKKSSDGLREQAILSKQQSTGLLSKIKSLFLGK